MLFVQSDSTVLASEFMFSSETVIGLVDTVWVGSVGTVFQLSIFSYSLLGARCSVHSWCDGSFDRSLMVDPLSYFSTTGITNK